MPANIQAVPGTNSIYATKRRVWNDESSTLWRPWWAYAERGPTSRCQHGLGQLGGRWPSRAGFAADPAAGQICLLGAGQDVCLPGGFENWHFHNGGCAATKFLMGTTKDSGGNIVSGATVQGFLTSSDAYVGETTSDTHGRFMLGTPNPGKAHYLVAYRAGSPDIAGTTVNTLVPTNADGS